MNPAIELRNFITPHLISAAASSLGESSSSCKLAIQYSIPILLDSLIHCEDKISQEQIWDLINHSNNRSNLLNDLDGLFSGLPDNYCGPDSLGAELINITLKKNYPISLAQVSALRHTGNLQRIFSLVAPMVLSYFKKKVRLEGFGISGFFTWIKSQEKTIHEMLPSDLLKLNTRRQTDSHFDSNIEASFPEENTNWLPWLISIFGLLGLMFLLMRSCQHQKSTLEKISSQNLVVDTSISDQKKINPMDTQKLFIQRLYDGLDSTNRKKWLALGNFKQQELPNGLKIIFPENGMEGKLINWIADTNQMIDKTTWLDFDRILFESASSTLNLASKNQIQNISEILLAYPNVKIKIGAYTDNIGKPANNLKLSKERAERISEELELMNIDSNRIVTEGYGATNPIGDNSRGIGREKNIRIAIRVIKK